MTIKDVNLPKWPQMFVSGSQVTIAQAKEIIFRTDRFFSDVGFYPLYANKPDITSQYLYQKAAGIHIGINSPEIDYEKVHRLQKRVDESIKFIDDEWLMNDWGLSSFIGGPHGWCHPDGCIGFDDNIGKWPSVNSVKDSWCVIAKEFPYLDLVATLMSGESYDNDTVPLVDFIVKNGVVSVEAPNFLDSHKRFCRDIFPLHTKTTTNDIIYSEFEMYANMFGVPLEWYSEFAIKIRRSLGMQINWQAIDELNSYLATEIWSKSG